MTKTNTKRSNSSAKSRTPFYRNFWVWAIFIAIIIVAILIFIFTRPNNTQQDTNNRNQQTTIDTKPDDQAKPDQDKEEAPEPEDKTQRFEGEDPNELGELTGSVVRKTVSDGNLTIVAMIDQYLSEPGICIITLKGKNQGNTYTASADAVADVTTSNCNAFVIPTSNLSSDTYQIMIELNGNGKKGTIIDEVAL